MFAVIKTGGKQYRVAAEDVIRIEKVAGEVGEIVTLGSVLAYGEGEDVTIGAPFVDGASVAVEVVDQGKAKTVIAFKKRRRQNSRRKRGHRQLLTTVRISEILVAGAKPSKKAAPKKEAAADIADDVSLISGVGPVLKDKLAEAGITSLKQIATLKKKDVAKLDEDLSLGGRIEREEWVAQAKELLAGKPPRAKVDQEAQAQAEGE
ncbi:MAG: 50S ribosomal protein L21 [Aquamicrobium sp.]|jgi:large subunit ribosomal protein L21|uniref:50S ribosomal protein L21 n=1 Tax=Aquamicrobium sp. TaxID=1872579 RepID=UPI00349E8765|nr:50S ribosomal protein L21 [Aquamicrobium sp.]